MNDAASNLPALPPASEADHWSRRLALRQLQLLGQLAEIGLEISAAIERQAGGQAPATVVKGDLALAYARVTRSVRQTVLLQTRLIDDLKGAEPAAEPEQPEAAPVEQRKVRVGRIVERLVQAEHPDDEEELDVLMTEAYERLDDEDLYGDLMDRPVSELVARICKDLGLEPDWSELAAELWARKEIASGEPGFPLEALTAPRAEADRLATPDPDPPPWPP